MKELLREFLCLAIASFVGWWLFLRPTTEVAGVARIAARPALSMEVTPLLTAPPTSGPDATLDGLGEELGKEVAQAEPAPEAPGARVVIVADREPAVASVELESADEQRAEELAAADVGRTEEDPAQTLPPPPELGTPEGAPDARGGTAPEPDPASDPPPAEVAEVESASAPTLEPETAMMPATSDAAPSVPQGTDPDGAAVGASGAPEVAQLMRDPELLAAAGAELSGEERRGFATVLLATPEEQLAIARFFGEELVLVPRATLDPDAADPRWFRVVPETGGVEELRGHPPLERFRQYRDLFDYEYARLPDELRSLRRTLAARRDVYLFAALLPAREWAVVVARRAEALAQAGRELSDVRRIVLRYRRLADGTFDLAVDHLQFVDGSRYPSIGGTHGAPANGEGDRAR